MNRVKQVLSVALMAFVAASCSSSPSTKPHHATTTTTTLPSNETAPPTNGVGTYQLEAMLMKQSDIGIPWQNAASSSAGQIFFPGCLDRLNSNADGSLAQAAETFDQGADSLPIAFEELNSFPNGSGASNFTKVTGIFNNCKSTKFTKSGQTVDISLQPQSLQQVGDESQAYTLTFQAGSASASAGMMVVRKGDIIALVAIVDHSPPSSQELVQVATVAASKMNVVVVKAG